MGIKEIMFELLQKEMKQLEKEDRARPNDFVGMDRYDSDEELRARIAGFNKYTKMKSIMSSIEQHLNIQELSKQVPDWREILEDLIQKEMEQLEKNGHARPNDFVGMDRYDSDEELCARNDDFNRYSKLKDFRIKLDATRKSPTKKSLMERLSGKKLNKESLFDEER